MKKTLSRLLCVLLVAAMVCAMVPAVAAANSSTVTGTGTKSDPYILYVGDWVDATGDAHKVTGHTLTYKYTQYLNNDVPQTPSTTNSTSGFVYFNTSTWRFEAKKTTLTANGDDGYVKAEISCQKTVNNKKTACDTFTTIEKYFRVYSPSKGLALKNGSTTLGTNDTLSVIAGSTGVTLDYSILSGTGTAFTTKTTANQQNVGEPKPDGSQTVTATVDRDKQKITVTAADGVGSRGYIDIPYGEGSNQLTRRVKVVVTSGATVTIKNGSTVISDELFNAIDAEGIKTLSVANGSSALNLTATVDVGNANDISWESSNSSVAVFNASGLQIKSSGETLITAWLNKTGKVGASFKLVVTDNITNVTIKKSDGSETLSQKNAEISLNGGLSVKAFLTPAATQTKNGKYTVWTSSNYDVASFYGTNVAIDPDTLAATGESVNITGKSAGTVTITATVGGKSSSFTLKVNPKAKDAIVINRFVLTELSAKVRNGTATEIVDRMNANDMYKQVPAVVKDSNGKEIYIYVPVDWTTARKTSDTTAKVYGQAMTSDGENTYDYGSLNTQIIANVELTNDAIVSKLSVTGDKSTAVAGNVINLTADATVEPSDASVAYQWYVNGKAISGATAKTAKYTIPQASVDSATVYNFTCVVTASKAGTSNSAESQPFTVNVSRDYTVTVSVNDSKATYTVGEKIKATATLYYKGSAVSSTSFSWQLLDTNKGNAIGTDYAAISGSGSSAEVTTKGTDSADGDKYILQATITYTNGYTYSGSETVTVKPAAAKDVKMTVATTGGNIKGSTITNAVKTAVNNSDLTTSYITFSGATGGRLYTSSTAKTTLGTGTACYVSGSTGQKLNDVYFVPSASATSSYVTYAAHNAKGGVIATGRVTFDTTETSGTNIYSKGTTFEAAGLVDDLAPADSSNAYVVFGTVKGGTLYYNYKSYSNKSDVAANDKFYFSGSSKLLEDVYFLPAADTYTATIEYTVYSGSGSSLSSDKITFTTVKQTASRTFNDVTKNDVGSWASNAIDFMAANEIVGGTGNSKFSPKANMTRAQLVAVLYRSAGSPSVSGIANPFTDVAQSQYYYNAVLWAYSKGIVTGNSATTFNPNGNISRQDIAAILYRYAGNPTATGSVTSFTDNAKIATYALPAMKWAVGNGYIGGSNNKLNPTGQATRAEVAAMLHRFFTK